MKFLYQKNNIKNEIEHIKNMGSTLQFDPYQIDMNYETLRGKPNPKKLVKVFLILLNQLENQLHQH